MEPIYFFHNPKAGGSSLQAVLRSKYLQESVAPLLVHGMIDQLERNGDYRDFRGYSLYAGHNSLDVYLSVKNGHRTITNFRHPTTRLISLYNFFRYSVIVSDDVLRSKRYTAVKLAKEVGFHEFLASESPDICVYTSNQHTRQLSASMWEYRSEREVSAPTARRTIDELACYYVCEYPELSNLWLKETLGLPQLPTENVTEFSGKLTIFELKSETHKLLLEKNKLDVNLYIYAVNKLLKKYTATINSGECMARFWARLTDRTRARPP